MFAEDTLFSDVFVIDVRKMLDMLLKTCVIESLIVPDPLHCFIDIDQCKQARFEFSSCKVSIH